MGQLFGKNDWFYTASGVSMSEKLASNLPENHRRVIPSAMPKDAQQLLISRKQGVIFCISSRKTVDDVRI